MKQRIKIITVTKSQWFENELPFIIKSLEQSKGRTIEKVDIESLSPPTSIPTRRDSAGDVRPDWDWFKSRFSEPNPEYNVICLHISEYYRDKWGLSRKIGGTYLNDPGPQMEFFVVADRNHQAPGYGISQFQRRFIHEMLHGDTYFAGQYERNWVHLWDYSLKKIDEAPKYIDYTPFNIRIKMIELLDKAIALLWRLKL